MVVMFLNLFFDIAGLGKTPSFVVSFFFVAAMSSFF